MTKRILEPYAPYLRDPHAYRSHQLGWEAWRFRSCQFANTTHTPNYGHSTVQCTIIEIHVFWTIWHRQWIMLRHNMAACSWLTEFYWYGMATTKRRRFWTAVTFEKQTKLEIVAKKQKIMSWYWIPENHITLKHEKLRIWSNSKTAQFSVTEFVDYYLRCHFLCCFLDT